MNGAEQKSFQRQVAFKVMVSDILDASLDGELLSSAEGLKMSRVNVIAYAVYKPENYSNYASMIIDDGTGKIMLRVFENANIFSGINIGDAIIVIGRVREFNNERYIMPEIVKKLDSEWLNTRKLELNRKVVEVRMAAKENVTKKPDAREDIYLLIRSLDTGDGVSFEYVIEKSKNSEAENIIRALLENGDVFEIRPGKLKVLE